MSYHSVLALLHIRVSALISANVIGLFWCYSVIAVLSFLIMSVHTASPAQPMSVINAVNLGAVFYRHRTINVYSADAYLNFIVTQPKRPDFTKQHHALRCTSEGHLIYDTEPTRVRIHDGQLILRNNTIRPTPFALPQNNLTEARVDRVRRCAHVLKLVHVLDHVRRQALQDLNMLLTDAASLINQWPSGSRVRRGWFDILGRGMATVTGVAGPKELAQIQARLKQLALSSFQATHAARLSASAFMTATKVTSHKIDALNHLVNMTSRSVLDTYQQVFANYRQQTREIMLLSNTIELFSNLSSQTVHMQMYHSALKELHSGRLPLHFVSHSALVNSVATLQSFLRTHHPGLFVLREDLDFYYMHATFSVYQCEDDHLCIILKCTLTTVTYGLDLYDRRTLPMSRPEYFLYSLLY